MTRTDRSMTRAQIEDRRQEADESGDCTTAALCSLLLGEAADPDYLPAACRVADRGAQLYRLAYVRGEVALCSTHSAAGRGPLGVYGECQDARRIYACDECTRQAQVEARRILQAQVEA